MGMVAPTDNVRLVGLKVVYMDSIGSLLLAGVHNVGVDLSSLDVGVSEHILDDIDVGTHFELERSIRMTKAVEGDMFLNASCLNPFLQWLGNPCGSLKSGKD